MPRIQCPSCQHWLKLPREVRNAKLRCSKCGTVFTGSSQEEAPPAAPASDDPAAALAAAVSAAPTPAPKPARPDAPTTSKAARPAAPPKQKAAPKPAEPAVKVVTVFKRKKSNAPAIIAGFAALMLIPILGLLIFGLTHKHLVLTDPKGRIVLDQWMSNDDAQVAAEEHKKKYEPNQNPVAAGSGAIDKPASAPTGTGNVSEGGAVGVAKIVGDAKFTIENMKYDADQANVTYTGVVRSHHDKPVESVELSLRFGRTPTNKVPLQWIAPNGCVPFSITVNGMTEADAKKAVPEGVFGEPKVRKDMGGYDVPFAEVGSPPTDDPKTILLSGSTTNHTTTALRDAILYVDFVSSDKGVVQDNGQCVKGELKSKDLMPEGKVEYKVTWDVAMQGVPLKYFVRVIGTTN